ncbi:MAG: tetratricopeptide repeat protein [Planctomycetes bacterium]|nr:tetratricopeptide repeat protein [Planctomycetota bacterium]
MSLDPYISCPCGSGKKFKWCCASYYPEVERALALEQQSQHEAALLAMKELTKKHADKPAVWGYYAQFLYNSGQGEQAEEAVSEALKLNPNFGMAHFLRAQFRENEGEVIGALLLYRKAAEGYDPEAHDALTNVYLKIYQHETMLNRPVAARAAIERAVHLQPAVADIREQFEGEFGDESPLPAAARKKYVFRPTAKPVSAELATGKFGDARKAFEQLTALTPGDPSAWFNLGVVLAWIGEQPKAVEALQKCIDLETDDHRAEEAGALIEVLRCGHGMEAEADNLAHGFIMPIREPNAVMQMLQAWGKGGKLRGVRSDQERGLIMGVIVEELPSLLAVGGSTLARVAAKMIVAGGAIRVSHPNRESSAKVADEVRTTLQLAVEAPQETTTPISLGDVALEALAQPLQTSDLTATENKLRDHARNFFENVWIHRPLKSLAGNGPLDAVGSSVLRKRVFGVVKFMEDCFKAVEPHKQVGEQVVPINVYDFDALRHKLGLEYITADPPKVDVPAEAIAAPTPAAAAPVVAKEQPRAPEPKPAAPAKRDISALNAGELAGLDLAALSVEELEQAMRAAVKLDAKELAVAFAQAGVLKPFDAAKPDRYPMYAVAITGASVAGELAKAVELSEQGEKYDAEHNGGSRGIDFSLKRAQLFVKMKDADKAVIAFDSIIARHPDEGKFYTVAAEEMLRLKSGAKALSFAERGLAKAKEQNNRDLEGHCSELIAAAKRS